MKKQQSGFTLIELIIVIVILGILAVTAAPKFINIQGDATRSTLQGLKAAIQGGSQLIYAKSAIASKQKAPTAGDATSQLILGSGTVEIDFGYPDAETITSNSILSIWVEISDTDFTVVAGTSNPSTPAAGTFAIISATGSPTIDYSLTGVSGLSCHVLYTEATNANTPAQVTAVTGGC